MRTLRLVPLVLLASALAPSAPGLRPLPAALADDGTAGLRFFEDAWKKQAKGVADKFWEVAADARRANLFEFACEAAARAIDFDPDHKDARDYLCWVKRSKGWERDEDAYGKLQKQNAKNDKESQQTFDKKVEKWREARRKVDQYAAAKYAQLGAACAAKGYEEQAQKAYERALLLDPDSEAAHKSLGHVQVGKLWIPKARLDALQKAAEGEWIVEESDYDKGLGVHLNKMQSPHFRVFDDGDREMLPEHIKTLETLYTYFLADVGIDPGTDVLEGKRIDLVVVSTQPVWEKWVDDFSNSADKQWTKGTNTSRSYNLLRGGVLRVETAEVVDTRDPLLHHAAHFLGQAIWKARPYAWLDEGLVYYYTVRVQDTTRTSCLDKLVTGYGNQQEVVGGDKDWTLSERWRDFLRDIVKAKADTELRTIVLTPLATLRLPDSVKAWAVVTWLMQTRRDEFIEYLRRVRDEPQLDQEKAVREVFKCEIEELDAQWRAYALRAF